MATESLEVRSLRALAADINARVTSTTGGQHSSTSWHYAQGTDGAGLAIDLAETSGPSALTPGLKRIATEVARRIGPSCVELIYADGPCLRFGKPFVYSASVLAAHHNHIHVAVPRGFRWAPPAPPQPTPKEPIVVNAAPVALLTHPAWGKGYTIVTADGGVFNFGGSPFFGSLGNITLNKPIIRAAVSDTGQGYLMLGADGGVFCFGDARFEGAVQYAGS